MHIDVLNAVLDLSPELAAIRSSRPEFVNGAEDCRNAVLQPVDCLGLERPLRAALAARMSRINGNETLAAYYREKLGNWGSTPDLELVAAGGHPAQEDPWLRAVLRHVDFITIAPRACTKADTLRLTEAGASVPQVVALSELIGFVNFEVRIAATLKLLENVH